MRRMPAATSPASVATSTSLPSRPIIGGRTAGGGRRVIPSVSPRSRAGPPATRQASAWRGKRRNAEEGLPMLAAVKKQALWYARVVGVPGTFNAQAIFQDGSEQERRAFYEASIKRNLAG